MQFGKRVGSILTVLSTFLLLAWFGVEITYAQPHLSLDKQVYEILEPIEATFSNGPGNPTDWVGIYKPGQVPGNGVDYSTLWLYVNGTQTADVGLSDAWVTFDPGLSEAGDWWAGFFANDVYELLDSLAFKVTSGSGVGEEASAEMPESLSLNNYPNPFNPGTTITFNLPGAGEVTLKIIDIRGEVKATLVRGTVSRGRHTIRFNGESLASGVYFILLQTGQRVATHRMLLMK